MSPLVGVLIVVGVVLLVLVGAMLVYNGLMSRRLTAQQDYATVEGLLKRRREEIAALANLVRGPLAYHPALFEALDATLDNARAARTPNANAAAQADMEQALNNVVAAVDRQPAVRSGQDLQALRTQLVASLHELEPAVNNYNISVSLYNAHCQAFPTSLIASIFGLSPMQRYEDTRQNK